MTDTQTIDDGTNANVVVSVDAMGGDKGPSAIVAGLLRAVHTHSNIPCFGLAAMIIRVLNP